MDLKDFFWHCNFSPLLFPLFILLFLLLFRPYPGRPLFAVFGLYERGGDLYAPVEDLLDPECLPVVFRPTERVNLVALIAPVTETNVLKEKRI